MTEQEVNWIFSHVNTTIFLRFFCFCFERPSIFYVLMMKIILSLFINGCYDCFRRFVRLGRKLCLFVYYVEHINNKEWMAKEPATFNGGVEGRMMHDNIRRRNQEQCGRSVWFFLILF